MPGVTPAAAAAPAVPERYVVVLRDEADPRAVAQEHASAHALGVAFVYQHALKGYAARIPAARLAQIQADPRVAFVSVDRPVWALDVVPGRPGTTGKGGAGAAKSGQGGSSPAQQAPTGLRRIGGSTDGVHQTLGNKGAGVGIAVIDTGIDLTHPDLSPVAGGTTCVTGTANASDDHGHGSHVAGTIGARDNTIGVVGVAPEVTLYAVKVMDATGAGTWAQVICGIDWVTANAGTIKVANLSLGGYGSATPSKADCTNGNSDALHLAICKSVKAGVTYVVAAGNDFWDAGGQIPAAYEEVITVSALADFNGLPGGGAKATCRNDVDDTFANFSNFGAAVDIAAPGVCILSTWKAGGYNTISGTSMAAPHVAGAAALYKAANPGVTPAQVRSGLIAGWEPGPLAGDPGSYKEGVVHLR
ncbi:MAG: S8 family serine peptidase [Chloroflexi bacterium]|nr:S8 family serine peptidase [Chloroflexota bacterium]